MTHGKIGWIFTANLAWQEKTQNKITVYSEADMARKHPGMYGLFIDYQYKWVPNDLQVLPLTCHL